MSEGQGKYGALIQQARKPDCQITSNPETQIEVQPETESIQEKQVNLCIKVPVSLRRHWAAESKRQGVTMTEVIVKALTNRFGQP